MFSIERSGPPVYYPTESTMAFQHPSSTSPDAFSSTIMSLEPSMDGPPSPERIRAYTEQMKRSSLFNGTKSLTTTSATSSLRSMDSTQTSTDGISTPSRKSSLRSNASIILPQKSERPESVNLFGKTIFSRTARRPKFRGNSDGGRSLSASVLLSGVGSGDQSAKEHYYDFAKNKRRGTLTLTSNGEQRRDYISKPFNFQHLTHTRQEEVPDLERTTGPQLQTEFLLHRASQAPKSELKGIRAEDLHFRNFSSIAEDNSQEDPRTERRRLQKSSPPQPRRTLKSSRSHDSLRTTPPPRPPRSPLSPHYPRALPPRVSSRTASVLYETFDPLASASIERPQTSVGFRKAAPMSLPSTPGCIQSDDLGYFNQPIYSAPISPRSEQWPLRSAESSFGSPDLEDVPEEDEGQTSRRSKFKMDVRSSQSVPNFHLPQVRSRENLEFAKVENELPTPSVVEHPASENGDITASATTKRLSFMLLDADWEADIDYCYDHEVEANCDYEWTRASLDTTRQKSCSIQVSQPNTPALTIDNDNEDTHFRPSLLVPTARDIPELSPFSALSIESDLRTPNSAVRPTHRRFPSQASSFKESHGFSLSPSLLIPRDFSAQMEQEDMYSELQDLDMLGPKDLPMYQGHPMEASNEDSHSSKRASERSSGFSHTNSYESMSLSSRAASIVQEHRSIGSTGSLPDLVHSRRPRTRDGEANETEVAEALTVDEVAHIIPEVTSPGCFNKLDTLSELAQSEQRTPENYANFSYHIPSHGRKTSAPVNMQEPKAVLSGRQRSQSSAQLMGPPKKRERSSKGYTLFPQV